MIIIMIHCSNLTVGGKVLVRSGQNLVAWTAAGSIRDYSFGMETLARKKDEQILAPNLCVSSAYRIKNAWDLVLDVKHFTGPYLQRTHLRHLQLLRPSAADAFNLHQKK
jgi:hypothetical protein